MFVLASSESQLLPVSDLIMAGIVNLRGMLKKIKDALFRKYGYGSKMCQMIIQVQQLLKVNFYPL